MVRDPFDGLDPEADGFPEAVAELLSLPSHDPRRQALTDTPRGRALLAAYEAFLDPPDVPPGADPADAMVRLRAVLDREEALGADRAHPTGATPDDRVAPRDAETRSAASGGRGSDGRGFWSRLWADRGLAGLTPVAAAAVAVAILVLTPSPDGTGLRLVRSGTELRGGEPVAADPLRLEVHGTADGARLGWRPVAGAASYEVEIRTPAHTSLARWRVDAPPAAMTEVTWPEGERRAPALLWRVTALDAAGAPVETSRWSSLDAGRVAPR